MHVTYILGTSADQSADNYAHLNDDELYMSDDGMDEFDDIDNDIDDEEFIYGVDSVDDDSSPTLKYWTPRCLEKMKPSHLMKFNTLGDAYDYYRAYAKKVGFDVRIGNKRTFIRSNIIKEQYYCCNRKGTHIPKTKNWERTITSTRVGCGAKFMVRASSADSEYTCLCFEERHTHDMMPLGGRHLMKSHRELNIGHQKFMLICARSNMGPVKSYNFFKENVRWTLLYCCNEERFQELLEGYHDRHQ